MSETTRKLIEVARERRQLWQMARTRRRAFAIRTAPLRQPHTPRPDVVLGQGPLWFICYQGKPIIMPPWRNPDGTLRPKNNCNEHHNR